jgi:hypothetical protein
LTEIRCPLKDCEYNHKRRCLKKVITLKQNFHGRDIRCDDMKEKTIRYCRDDDCDFCQKAEEIAEITALKGIENAKM